ncbi:helix-turn-helix domain-containing protein [Streptomyces pathocidini]|uniref:helix-turn-helix domain-containing protein n=1 Tax=Streptomyces pathocidini TaxID=1650571 RepID=UPI003F4D4D8C
MALRARIVLWSGEGRRRKGIAELAGVALLTVDRCKARYTERGLVGLEEKRCGGPRTQVPPQVRARVIASTRMSPPADSGLSHWSTRTLADHLKRREGVSVSWTQRARTRHRSRVRGPGRRVRGLGRRTWQGTWRGQRARVPGRDSRDPGRYAVTAELLTGSGGLKSCRGGGEVF